MTRTSENEPSNPKYKITNFNNGMTYFVEEDENGILTWYWKYHSDVWNVHRDPTDKELSTYEALISSTIANALTGNYNWVGRIEQLY